MPSRIATSPEKVQEQSTVRRMYNDRKVRSSQTKVTANKDKANFSDCIQGQSHEVFKNNENSSRVKDTKLGSYREENSTSAYKKLSREKLSLMALQYARRNDYRYESNNRKVLVARSGHNSRLKMTCSKSEPFFVINSNREYSSYRASPLSCLSPTEEGKRKDPESPRRVVSTKHLLSNGLKRN